MVHSSRYLQPNTNQILELSVYSHEDLLAQERYHKLSDLLVIPIKLQSYIDNYHNAIP